MPDESPQVTRLLDQWKSGNEAALNQLMEIIQPELRRMAQSFMRRETPNHTWQPTALVNEAVMKLMDQRVSQYENRAHFYGLMATLMRRALREYARSKHAGKRGSGQINKSLEEMFQVGGDVSVTANLDPEDLVAIDLAMEKLEKLDARRAEMIALFFYAGRTTKEIAEMLNVSESTVDRDLRLAKALLKDAIAGA